MPNKPASSDKSETRKIILVTGANGFIGRALVKSLCLQGYEVRGTVRSSAASTPMLWNMGELTEKTDWQHVLHNVDTVIHCAARAHILRETTANPQELYRQMNTHVTTNLARQASEHGVRRFIFLSSIGVLGPSSENTPFTEDAIPNPQVPYAQAKWEAEQALHALPGTMDKIIIRPPLVYGPGVKGNFGTLLKAVNQQIPMPLGAINNKRQFVGIDNLIHFILTCITTQGAINETFLIADKDVVSTTQLLRNLAHVLNKKARLLPVPPQLLRCALNFIGKSKLATQLLGNLEINTRKAHSLLGWEPPYTMQEQLRQIASESQ